MITNQRSKWRDLIKLHPYRNALILGTHTNNKMKDIKPSYENKKKLIVMHYFQHNPNECSIAKKKTNVMLMSVVIAPTFDDSSGSTLTD